MNSETNEMNKIESNSYTYTVPPGENVWFCQKIYLADSVIKKDDFKFETEEIKVNGDC